MNVTEISNAIVELATSPSKRQEMGECGYNRVMKGYQIHQMKQTYLELYQKVGAQYNCTWPEEPFDIRKHREK